MSGQSEPLEFQDPLEDYEPKQYDDPLEQALAEETVASVQSTPYASVPSDTPVAVAVERLTQLHVACLLIEDDERLVGVFSDRDVLNQVALEYDSVKDKPVAEVMTSDPVYVYETDSSAAVLAVMAISGYRHVPVLNLEDKIVGIASPQRVTAFLQRHFDGIH